MACDKGQVWIRTFAKPMPYHLAGNEIVDWKQKSSTYGSYLLDC
jgi:hypothetical protein